MKRFLQIISVTALVLFQGTGAARAQELADELKAKLQESSKGKFKTRTLDPEKLKGYRETKRFIPAGVPPSTIVKKDAEPEGVRKPEVMDDNKVGTRPAEEAVDRPVVETKLASGGSMKVSIPVSAKIGERIELEILGSEDMYIRVYHFSSDQFTTELYPGDFSDKGFRPKDKALRISWETTLPGGHEDLVVFASSEEIGKIVTGTKPGSALLFGEKGVFVSLNSDLRASENVTEAFDSLSHAKIGYDLKED